LLFVESSIPVSTRRENSSKSPFSIERNSAFRRRLGMRAGASEASAAMKERGAFFIRVRVAAGRTGPRD